MTNTFQTFVQTDYGIIPVTGDSAQIIKDARKRKRDGQPDLRFTRGKLAQFVIMAITERAKAVYIADVD